MNYRLSNTTTVVSLRLPNDVWELLDRRAKKQGKRVSAYIRARVIKELIRSHTKTIGKGEEETRKALAEGKGITFSNAQEAIRWLKSEK